MKFRNKTLVFLGSSVTYGAEVGYSMCDYLAKNTAATVVKWAVSGTTLSAAKENSYVERLLKVVDTQEKCDYFITQLSTNDASQGMELGKISSSFDVQDFDTKTITGAVEFIIATARKKWGCPVAFYTGTYFNSPKYQAMVDMITAVSKKWNIGVIDLWNDSEMRAVSEEDYKRYMLDGVHPGKVGYDEWWGPKFKQYFEEHL